MLAGGHGAEAIRDCVAFLTIRTLLTTSRDLGKDPPDTLLGPWAPTGARQTFLAFGIIRLDHEL